MKFATGSEAKRKGKWWRRLQKSVSFFTKNLKKGKKWNT